MDQDIACISLRPLSSSSNNVDITSLNPSGRSLLAAVGMWTDNSVRLLELPSLQEVTRLDVGVQVQIRDVLLISFNNNISSSHLLVGLGNGVILTYSLVGLDSNHSIGGSFVDRREITIGTSPIRFACFVNSGSIYVFAACDRPTVVYSKRSEQESNGGITEKLYFSVVNVNEVSSMTPFSSPLFKNCLAMTSDEALMIGTVDSIQKIHISGRPLQEAPRKICHHRSAGLFAVCSSKIVPVDDFFATQERVCILYIIYFDALLYCCATDIDNIFVGYYFRIIRNKCF